MLPFKKDFENKLMKTLFLGVFRKYMYTIFHHFFLCSNAKTEHVNVPSTVV